LIQGVVVSSPSPLGTPNHEPSAEIDSEVLAENVRTLTQVAQMRDSSTDFLGEAAQSLRLLVQFLDTFTQGNIFASTAWTAVSVAFKVRVNLMQVCSLSHHLPVGS